MGRLVLRRLGATVPVLLLVTAGVFALLHLTPGDPIDAMMAESVDATAKETLRRELNEQAGDRATQTRSQRPAFGEGGGEARRDGSIREQLLKKPLSSLLRK